MAPENAADCIIDEILLTEKNNDNNTFNAPHAQRKEFSFGGKKVPIRWEHLNPQLEYVVLHPHTLIAPVPRSEIPDLYQHGPDPIRGVIQLRGDDQTPKKAFQFTSTIPTTNEAIYQIVLPKNHYCDKRLIFSSDGVGENETTKAYVITRRIDEKNIQQNISWYRPEKGDGEFAIYFFGPDIHVLDQILHNKGNTVVDGPLHKSIKYEDFREYRDPRDERIDYVISENLQ
jgi:hypothetical protein